MKRIANYLIVLTLAVFAFTSCEDVPSPFGQIVAPKSEEGEVIEPSGKGTLAEPYNVAGVIEYLSGLGADVPSPNDVYIKGVITSITEAFGTQYGNATFEISDTENASNKFLCYRVKYLGNTSYSDPSAWNIKEGNTVIICGKVVNYKGNTPETSANAAYVYSINGQGGSGGGGGETPTEVKKVTIAEFNAAAESATQYYQLTGTVKNLKDGDQYGNFDLEDATGSVYVYGLLAEKGGESKKFQELAAAKGIKNGVTLTINGLRSSYNNKVQVKSAYFVSVEAGSGGGGGGDAKGTGTANDPFNVAAAIAKCKEAGETATSQIYYVKGIVNAEYTVDSYKNATFDLVDSEGSSEKFTAYRVKGADGADLKVGYKIPKGATVIVSGKLVNFKGNTPETAQNSGTLISVNGNAPELEGGSGGGGGDTGGAKGTGTQSDPFNVAAAIAKCKEVGETATSQVYFVKGIVNAEYTVDSYKNATFDLVDSEGSSEKFTAFRVKGADGADLKVGYKIPKGATVIVSGKLVNYKGNTPETAQNSGTLISVNGNAPELDGEGGGGTSGGGATSGDEITVAMNSFGLDNAADLTTLTLSDGTKLTFSQGEGTNGPKYYNSGNAARLYIGNSMTIDAGSKKITKVVINAYADNNASYTAEGNVSGKAGSQNVTPTLSETTFTFSGFSSSTLVVSNNATGTGGSKQLRIVSMTITYAK